MGIWWKMEEREQQLLVDLIEKYGAPAIVQEIKTRLQAFILIDWRFDKNRWQRQLSAISREEKLRHNLSRVAKELAAMNRVIANVIFFPASWQRMEVQALRMERHNKKREREQAEADRLRAIERKRTEEKRQKARVEAKAAKELKMKKSLDSLYRTHREYLQKQMENIDKRLGE